LSDAGECLLERHVLVTVNEHVYLVIIRISPERFDCGLDDGDRGRASAGYDFDVSGTETIGVTQFAKIGGLCFFTFANDQDPSIGLTDGLASPEVAEGSASAGHGLCLIG